MVSSEIELSMVFGLIMFMHFVGWCNCGLYNCVHDSKNLSDKEEVGRSTTTTTEPKMGEVIYK